MTKYAFLLFSLAWYSPDLITAQDPISNYKKYISPLLAGDCRSHPTCSSYGKAAFERYPPIKAALLTSDRLIRCGNDHHLPVKKLDYGIAFDDPIEFQNSPNPCRLLWSYNFTCLEPRQAKVLNLLREKGLLKEAIAQALEFMTDDDRCKAELIIFISSCQRNLNASFSMWNELATIQGMWGPEARFEEARILFTTGNYASIQAQLNTIQTESRYPIFIGLSQLMSGDWDAVQAMPNCIPKRNESAWDNFAGTKKHKPAFAGLLGIIPGLGYAYVGQSKSALSAIFTTAIFTIATTEAFALDSYALGSLTGIIAASFYSGSIFGAKRAAERQNHLARQQLFDEIIKTNPGLYE